VSWRTRRLVREKNPERKVPRNRNRSSQQAEREIGIATVTDGRETIGFLLARGPLGVEALSASEHSLGLFPTQRQAANAISEHAAKQCRRAS
jgi:hypothetical protein